MGKSYIDKDRASFDLEWAKIKHLRWNDPYFRHHRKKILNPYYPLNRFLLHTNRRNREVSLFKQLKIELKEKIFDRDMKDQISEYLNNKNKL